MAVYSNNKYDNKQDGKTSCWALIFVPTHSMNLTVSPWWTIDIIGDKTNVKYYLWNY